MVAALIGILSVVLLVRPREGEAFTEGMVGDPGCRKPCCLLCVYAYTLDSLGFVITTVFFLLAELLLIGVRRPVYLVLVPLGLGVGLFYLFRVFLEVPLPVSGLGGLPI